jgi:outer membrane protein assembly factor BamB
MKALRWMGTLVILAPALVVGAEEWSQWRGPARSGRASDVVLPEVWPESPPEPAWKTDVGDGYSSPVISAGRLFVMGRTAGEFETCYALDAATGKQIWAHSYPARYTPADPSAGRGPKSTPTVDGDRVYFYGVRGDLNCLNTRDGSVRWQYDCQSRFWGVERDSSGDDAWSTCCGASASPLVLGDLLVLPVGGKRAGAVTAFNKFDGTIAWKSLEDRSSYASPVAARFDRQPQIVAFTGLRMVGLNPVNGKLLWDYPFPAQFEQTMVTPVVWRDLVIIGGEKKPIVGLRIQPDGEQATSEIAWSNKDLKCYYSTPVVIGDHLYGQMPQRGQLVCLRLTDGKTAWIEPGFGAYASLVSAGKFLLVLTNDGELHVIEPSPEKFVRQAIWKVSEAGGTISHLAIAGRRLYIKDKQQVVCFDLR